MFSKCKTTKDQGNIGLGEAIAYFMREGHTVSIPVNDSQDYDLVADIDGLLSKIQVKTTRYISKGGYYQVSLKSSGGTRGDIYGRVCNSNIDYVFCLTEAGDKYLLPFIEIENNRSSITLSDAYEEFKVN